MSNVQITLVQVKAFTTNGHSLEVIHSVPIGTPQVIASSGTTQQSTLTATEALIRFPHITMWRIANLGTDHVYAVFGANPAPASIAAAAASGFGVPSGSVMYFQVDTFDQKVAIINSV